MIRVSWVHMLWKKKRLCALQIEELVNVTVIVIIVSSTIVMKNVSIGRIMSELTDVGLALSYRQGSIPVAINNRNTGMPHPPLILRYHRHHVGHIVKTVFVPTQSNDAL